jgi:hypothetical protein
MGADPNTSDRPPLAMNEPAAVIMIEVNAPLQDMLASYYYVKDAKSSRMKTSIR